MCLKDIIIKELNLNYDCFTPFNQNFEICTPSSSTSKFLLKTSKNFYLPNSNPFSESKNTEFNDFSESQTSSINSQKQIKFDPRMKAQNIPKMNYEPHRLDKIITNYKKMRDDKLQKLKAEKFQQKNWLELMKINREQPKNKVVLEDIIVI